MKDQEKLAALIGEDAKKRCGGCSGSGETLSFCEPRELIKCSRCNGTGRWAIKSPSELIEIAEGRWLDKHYQGEIESSRCSDGVAAEHSAQAHPFYCKYEEDFRAEDGDEVRVTGTGSTRQEAEMACAIEAMERLAEEKKGERCPACDAYPSNKANSRNYCDYCAALKKDMEPDN